MTIVDTADLRARACPHCAAVVWDRLAHERWHRRLTATITALYDTLTATGAAIDQLATIQEDPHGPTQDPDHDRPDAHPVRGR